jgi:hypothetical protein
VILTTFEKRKKKETIVNGYTVIYLSKIKNKNLFSNLELCVLKTLITMSNKPHTTFQFKKN